MVSVYDSSVGCQVKNAGAEPEPSPRASGGGGHRLSTGRWKTR
jgi:hypothetical protein